MNGDTTVDGSKYIYGEGYSTYAHGYGKSNNGIGKNYVVVSIKNQELWIVRKGRVAVHLFGTSCTSNHQVYFVDLTMMVLNTHQRFNTGCHLL